MSTHLKLLLQARHLQTHGAFCREYDRLAKQLDSALVNTWPSRATLHRWMTGAVKRLPYPDHCRILEAMFPGWTAEQLLQPCDDAHAVGTPQATARLIGTRQRLAPEPFPAPPLRRISRELWFKHTARSLLTISPLAPDGRRLMIQRTHDAANMSKFACQFAPAVEPGELVCFGYSCTGGRFVDELYWRQAVARHTCRLTITVEHEGVTLLRCSAVEELQDGSEVFATDELLWDCEGSDASMSVTRD